MWTVGIIKNIKQFKDMRNEWNVLLKNSRFNTIFLTWEWMSSWWEAYGEKKQLSIITVRNGNGNLVGIAPLLIHKSIFYGLPITEMTFIGKGCADGQDFIILEKQEEEVCLEIITTIYQYRKYWDIVNLDQIPEGSLLLIERILEKCSACKEYSSTYPYVSITKSWQDFSKGFSRNFKRDLKRKTDRMNLFGNWRFEVKKSVGDLEALIESIAMTEEKSRRKGTKKAFYSKYKNRLFMKSFMHYCLDSEWFDCSTISIEGYPIAYLIGFLYNNKYYAYTNAFLENYQEASPGKLLINEKLRWCFENATTLKEFDFLRGDHALKSLWTKSSRTYYHIVFFNRSVFSRIIKFGVFKMRPWLKKIGNKISSNSVTDL